MNLSNKSGNEFSQEELNSSNKMIKRRSIIQEQKLKLKMNERRISQEDIANILWSTSNSFKNINISFDFFLEFVQKDFFKFKHQIKELLLNETLRDRHRSEIEMILNRLDELGNEFELDYKSFYYYFKMNSFFSKWKVFDYEVFKKRCTSEK